MFTVTSFVWSALAGGMKIMKKMKSVKAGRLRRRRPSI
jgi:hypothetical protein